MEAPWNNPDVEWVCENHPTKEQGHEVWSWKKLRFIECGGAGMMDEKSRKLYKEI